MLGLQDRMACLCGNSYGKYGLSDEKDCSYTCIGNPKGICGGDWKSSVYAIDEGNFHCLYMILLVFFTKEHRTLHLQLPAF